MGRWSRLMVLFAWLRRPDQKPPYVERLDQRQDAVEARLDRLAEAYQRTDRLLRRQPR